MAFAVQIAEDWRKLDLETKVQAMLEYVEKITLSASTIISEDVEHLRQVGWSDREILDIALVSSYYNFRCRMADSLGVEIDAANVNQELLNELRLRNVTPDHARSV